MRWFTRSLLVSILSSAALAQNINLDTQVKGSREPYFSVDSGSANAYVLTTTAALGPGLRTGSCFQFFAKTSNTTASTANVDGTGATAIKKNISSALQSGDIVGGTPGQTTTICYDGTNFQLVGNGAFGNNSVGCSQMPALTGDVTSSSGSCATTLATVNSGSGTCGDSTHVCQVTTNGKGLVTSQSAIAITGGGGGCSAGTGNPMGCLIQEVTASGASSVSLTSCFSSSYDVYEITMQDVVVSASSTRLEMQFTSGGGVAVTTSTYSWAGWRVDTGGSSGADSGASQTFIDVGMGLALMTTNSPGWTGGFRVYNPLSTTMNKQITNGDGFGPFQGFNPNHRNWGGYNTTSGTAMDGIKIFPSSGTFSGTFRCYGLNK